MKRLSAILLLLLVFAAGCKQDEVVTKQQDSIVSFLKGSHLPKLISDAERQQSIDRNPPYYTVSGEAVYRYISTIYDDGRDQQPAVYWGSKVAITFSAYVFKGQNITTQSIPYFSNDQALRKAFQDAGLTEGLWSFEPLEVVVGETKIIKGLESALVGCRLGDKVEAYMTYTMAYGDQNFGVVPRQSPIVYFFTVDKVE